MLALLIAAAIVWDQLPRGKPVQIGYERASWRLAPERLPRILLPVSQILIRHRGSAKSSAGYEGFPDLPTSPPSRSRESALSIARELQKQVSLDSSKFETFARAQSEDVVSAPWGGSLGMVTAASLPPQALDALAQMQIGGVSQVIETRQGFHILRWEPTPAQEQIVAARQLTVAYREVDAAHVRDEHSKERSREQALELARRLVNRLKREPSRIDALIDEYSEHPSAMVGGDFGEWSSYAPDGNAREIAVLTQLEIGDVSQPLDGPHGFRILMRSALRSRVRYFWDEVFIAYDPGDQRARADAKDATDSIAKEIALDPAAFERFQKKYGSVDRGSFLEGRGDPLVQLALSKLSVGEVAEPIAEDGAFHIVRRREVDDGENSAPSPAPLFALPSPSVPDVDYLVASADARVVVSSLVQLASDARRALDLSPSASAQLDQILRKLADSRSGDMPLSERTAAVKSAWRDLQSALGDQQYRAFRRFLETWAANFLMARW